METLILSWYFYALMCSIILSSIGIGVYFGCFKKTTTKHDYTMAGRTMKPFPVAISLTASASSSDFLLGITSEVYSYGGAILLQIFTMVILSLVTIYVYMPVFFNLKVVTTYQYLELRFDRRTRLFVSFIFCVCFTFYLSLVIYVPSLALATVTGVKMYYVSVLLSAICIFYTCIGGLKTVIWTDTYQFMVVLATFVTVLVVGAESAGGVTNVWTKAVESKRLDIFQFDPDPTRRDSFWIVVIGSTINLMSYTSVDQNAMQKFLAISTLPKANLAVVFHCISLYLVQSICVCIGLIMYAKYGSCDPVTSAAIERNDQLLMLLVMDLSKSFTGLTSIFVIAIFTASLSAQSAITNCIAVTVYEDYLAKFVNSKMERKIVKLTVVVVGVVATGLVFLVEKLGDIFPLVFGLLTMAWGPTFGTFTLGFLFPRANSKGAFYGTLCGIGTLLCIALPATYYQSQGLLNYPTKELSTENCSFVNQTVIHQYLNSSPSQEVPSIFRISFYYYGFIGLVSTLVAGFVISYATNKNDPPVDRRLLSPVCRFYYKKEERDLVKDPEEAERLTM